MELITIAMCSADKLLIRNLKMDLSWLASVRGIIIIIYISSTEGKD